MNVPFISIIISYHNTHTKADKEYALSAIFIDFSILFEYKKVVNNRSQKMILISDMFDHNMWQLVLAVEEVYGVSQHPLHAYSYVLTILKMYVSILLNICRLKS